MLFEECFKENWLGRLCLFQFHPPSVLKSYGHHFSKMNKFVNLEGYRLLEKKKNCKHRGRNGKSHQQTLFLGSKQFANTQVFGISKFYLKIYYKFVMKNMT